MENKKAVFVLMLFLLVGILVGQSRARKSDFERCYDTCFEMCYAMSMGDFNIQETCPKCDDRCELRINRKACFLFWCWTVKKSS